MRAILLIVFGGFLAGGAYSLAKQGVPKIVVVITALAAALAIAGGIAWQL
jgi:hypothetical protein